MCTLTLAHLEAALGDISPFAAPVVAAKVGSGSAVAAAGGSPSGRKAKAEVKGAGSDQKP